MVADFEKLCHLVLRQQVTNSNSFCLHFQLHPAKSKCSSCFMSDVHSLDSLTGKCCALGHVAFAIVMAAAYYLA